MVRSYDYNYDDGDDDDDECRKIGSIRRLFKGFDRDYYKPISDDGFDGRRNNYTEYKSRGIDMGIYHRKNILI